MQTYCIKFSQLNVSRRRCLQIAAIFEFGGAMLLGRVVTSTIAGVSRVGVEAASH